MQLSRKAIRKNAVAFSKRRGIDGDEKSDGQNFMRDFLAVFGISKAVGRFEERAMRESGRGYMDYLRPKMIAIEMKPKGKNLDEAYRGAGGLDYVTCWFKKALDYIKKTEIEVAFVSTNSITQGEQAEILWRHLFADGIVINFAHQTFKWWNEAKGKAQVYCVIIGFAMFERSVKRLFRYDTPTSRPKMTKVQFINLYLTDAPDILVESRSKPLCDVPEMVFGSMPNDGGHLLLTPTERKQLVQNDSAIKDFIRPFMGAEEFINGTKRYCIWLLGVSPSSYRHNKDVLSRIAKVRNHRQNSKREMTKRLAERPAEFGEIRQPNSNYLIIPSVSTSGRRYIPMGFARKKYDLFQPESYDSQRFFFRVRCVDFPNTHGLDKICLRSSRECIPLFCKNSVQ